MRSFKAYGTPVSKLTLCNMLPLGDVLLLRVVAAAGVLAACSAACAAAACWFASSVVKVTTGCSSESNLAGRHSKHNVTPQLSR